MLNGIPMAHVQLFLVCQSVGGFCAAQKKASLRCRNFCKAKRNCWEAGGWLLASLNPETTQELLMEYAIFAGLGTMMVLYAVIIIQCLRHREW